MRAISLLLLEIFTGFGFAAEKKLTSLPAVLTNLHQVKTLTRATAKQKLPIRLHAVVTYFDAEAPDLFVQDGTDASWVIWKPGLPRPKVGDLIDLQGTSTVIDFAPEIANPSWTVLGTSPLPDALNFVPADLTSPGKDSHWVTAKGTIHNVDYLPLVKERSSLWMFMNLEGTTERVDIQIPWNGASLPSELIDAEVQVFGVCGAEFNATHQQIGTVLYVPQRSFVQVTRPPQMRDFAIAATRINALQTFSDHGDRDHRIKLVGSVSAIVPQTGFYLQDAESGLFVETRNLHDLQVGEWVEALGFVKVQESHLRLESAVFRRAEGGRIPRPKTVDVQQQLAGRWDSRLVTMTGTVIEQSESGMMKTLLLRQNRTSFPVLVAGHIPLSRYPIGTELQVTGVSSDNWTFLTGVTHFQILTRSENDLLITKHVPWWYLWHIFLFGAGLCAVLLIALGWVHVLRRRVRQQTVLIREKLAQAENFRQEAQDASRAKSHFLANMSHEIRTPMNGILGMTEAVLRTSLTADQRECLEIASSSTETLLAVVNDILDFSKIEAGKLELEIVPSDLTDIVMKAVNTVSVSAAQKGIELLCDVTAGTPNDVRVDPTRLTQVLLNLLSNAVKFTEEGEVTLTVAAESDPAGEMRLSFRISDTGIGIPPDRQVFIFEAFTQADSSTTRQFGGSGLGLTISSRLVAMMGGQLAVDSKVGRGSTFSFSILAGTQPTDSTGMLPKAGSRGLALIVDDNPASLEVLARMMGESGHTVLTALTASDAREQMRYLPSGERSLSLMIVDAHLRDDGAFKLVRSMQDAGTPCVRTIIMLIEAGHTLAAERSRLCGASDILTKPIHRKRLLEAIDSSTVAARKPHAIPSNGDEMESPTGWRILLAEDNRVNQKVAIRILERLGHQVQLAENGIQVLLALREGFFDLILMDVQMPEMDGIEACLQIRKTEGEGSIGIPIIALTAHALQQDRERCLQAGMNGYVTKPIRPDALAQELLRLADVLAMRRVQLSTL